MQPDRLKAWAAHINVAIRNIASIAPNSFNRTGDSEFDKHLDEAVRRLRLAQRRLEVLHREAQKAGPVS